jgi:hypothetical protein
MFAHPHFLDVHKQPHGHAVNIAQRSHEQQARYLCLYVLPPGYLAANSGDHVRNAV